MWVEWVALGVPALLAAYVVEVWRLEMVNVRFWRKFNGF
jgi:hypothetical protein